MRDGSTPALLAHLAAEREWYDVATGHLVPLVQELRAEMTGRVPATDSSVSWPQHGLFLLHGTSRREGSTSSC